MQTMLLAKDEIELESMLRSIDISVPRRSEGRTKEHTESYAIAHLLSALLGKNHLLFPLELVRRERPDFFLKVSGLEVGIEQGPLDEFDERVEGDLLLALDQSQGAEVNVHDDVLRSDSIGSARLFTCRVCRCETPP